jgi:hypothetical protein
MCTEYEELCAKTERKCDWIKCTDCVTSRAFCVVIGVIHMVSNFFRKKKEKYMRQPTLPQWGISTPVSGETTKTKYILKNIREQCLRFQIKELIFFRVFYFILLHYSMLQNKNSACVF